MIGLVIVTAILEAIAIVGIIVEYKWEISQTEKIAEGWKELAYQAADMLEKAYKEEKK